MRRRALLHAGLATGLAGVVPGLVPAARACEFSASTLRIIHPWTRQTADDANAAVVCMRFDQVQRSDRLIGVSTPVATRAEMGGLQASPRVDFAIPQGQESALSETGTFLRLTGLTQPLETGRAYPLTLVFEHGGSVPALLTVDYERFR